MKDRKNSGKMPMHTFVFLKDHTMDRLYKKGETIRLNCCETVENLIKNKIIK